MDTRRKILTHLEAIEVARDLRASGTSITLVSGYFDVLHPDVIRQLQSETNVAPSARVFALVLTPPAPLLSAQARMELAAALQVIDYVIESTSPPADFVALLAPDRDVHAQAAHLATRKRLIEHVLERHGRTSH